MFKCIFTGAEIHDNLDTSIEGCSYEYLSTVQIHSLVWHIFRRNDK